MLSSIRPADVLLLLLISPTTQAGPIRRAERFFPRGWNSTSSAVTASADAASSITSDPTDPSTSAFSVTAQEEQDGPTPSPIFITIDDSTRSTPAASPTGGQGPSSLPVESTPRSQTPSEPVFLPPPLSTITVSPTSASIPVMESSPTSTGEAATLPPMFSTITLPPHITSGIRNGSSLVPANPESTSAGAPGSLTETTTGPASTNTGAADASSVASQTASMKSSMSFPFPVPGASTAETATTAPAEPAPPSSTSVQNIASSTTAAVAQPSSDTPASLPTESPSFKTSALSSATLQVTGKPNTRLPTVRTSTPAATATVSPDVAASNLASAKGFNALFDTLTEQSACSNGQVACVKGNLASCGSNGAFDIQTCNPGTSCFALPMNTTEAVIIGCYDPTVANNILGAAAPSPAPGLSTSSAAQGPPASEIASEVTKTVTPIISATSTVLVTPPSNPSTSPAGPVVTATTTVLVPPPSSTPEFTSTVIVTKTVQPDPAPSSTTTEQEETTNTSSPARSSSRSSTITTETPEPTNTSVAVTGSPTSNVRFTAIDPTVPTVPVAKSTPSAGAVTVTVTVTEKEKETVTVTEKEFQTIILTVTKPST